MKNRFINGKGLEIIKSCEGLVLKAYRCAARVLTIGYGHTKNVTKDMVITKDMAEALLLEDLEWAENAVEQLVKVDLTDNQFSALVSLVFNIGEFAFKNSTMLRHVNNGDFAKASKEFRKWVFANGQILKGLERRRQMEETLFLIKE